MKILFLSTNDELGGAAIVTKRLVKALRRRGEDARMLVAHKNGAVGRAGKPGGVISGQSGRAG